MLLNNNSISCAIFCCEFLIDIQCTDRKALLKVHVHVTGVLVHAMHACVCNDYVLFFQYAC